MIVNLNFLWDAIQSGNWILLRMVLLSMGFYVTVCMILPGEVEAISFNRDSIFKKGKQP
jgi:hypothetical protein